MLTTSAASLIWGCVRVGSFGSCGDDADSTGANQAGPVDPADNVGADDPNGDPVAAAACTTVPSLAGADVSTFGKVRTRSTDPAAQINSNVYRVIFISCAMVEPRGFRHA